MKSWLKNVILLKTVDNVSFYVRRYDRTYNHKESDYLYEFDIDSGIQKKSLLPNHHYIYMEIMIDGKFNKRIGSQAVINFSGGLVNAVTNHINKEMIPKIDKYKKVFNK